MSPALPVQVTCPACQTTFMAQVHTIVDVGREPELKEAFLQGRLNTATCPNCGQGGMLAMPLLYHDPEKELLLVLVPDQLTLKLEEREKMVGDMVNALMGTIPAEDRKAYLLQPQTFFSIQRLMDEVLKAEGITQEMIDAQRKALELMQELMAAMDSDSEFETLVASHRDELDYQFFLLLSASIEAAEQEGDEAYGETLAGLRSRLLEELSIDIPEPLPEDASKEDLIAKLLEAKDDEEVQGLVISNRPMIDYGFFQALTERLEAAEAAGNQKEAAKLEALRKKVLDIADELDEQARQAQQRIVALVEELLAAEDMESAVSQHMASYDTLFFLILAGMIEAAERRGEEERLTRLQDLQKRVATFLEESMPPEFRLISELLSAEYPEGTAELLEKNQDRLTDDLVDTMKAILASWEDREHEEERSKLQGIIEQASAVLAEQGNSQ